MKPSHPIGIRHGSSKSLHRAVVDEVAQSYNLYGRSDHRRQPAYPAGAVVENATSIALTIVRCPVYSTRQPADFLRARPTDRHGSAVLHADLETRAVEPDHALHVIEIDYMRTMHANERRIR